MQSKWQIKWEIIHLINRTVKDFTNNQPNPGTEEIKCSLEDCVKNGVLDFDDIFDIMCFLAIGKGE